MQDCDNRVACTVNACDLRALNKQSQEFRCGRLQTEPYMMKDYSTILRHGQQLFRLITYSWQVCGVRVQPCRLDLLIQPKMQPNYTRLLEGLEWHNSSTDKKSYHNQWRRDYGRQEAVFIMMGCSSGLKEGVVVRQCKVMRLVYLMIMPVSYIRVKSAHFWWQLSYCHFMTWWSCDLHFCYIFRWLFVSFMMVTEHLAYSLWLCSV